MRADGVNEMCLEDLERISEENLNSGIRTEFICWSGSVVCGLELPGGEMRKLVLQGRQCWPPGGNNEQ